MAVKFRIDQTAQGRFKVLSFPGGKRDEKSDLSTAEVADYIKGQRLQPYVYFDSKGEKQWTLPEELLTELRARDLEDYHVADDYRAPEPVENEDESD